VITTAWTFIQQQMTQGAEINGLDQHQNKREIGNNAQACYMLTAMIQLNKAVVDNNTTQVLLDCIPNTN